MANIPAKILAARGDLRRALYNVPAPDEPVFSLGAVLRALSEGKRPGGYEGEILEAAASTDGAAGAVASTVCIPWQALALQRDMSAGVASSGGYLVQNARPAALVAFDGSAAGRLGVKIETGLKDNYTLAKCPSVLPVTWMQIEGPTATEQTPALGSVATSPKFAVSTVDVSGRLLRQGGPLVDSFLNALLMQAARSALDVAVFAGSGAAGQPLGLLNDPAIATVSGTSFNLATAASIQKAVADNVVSDESSRWAAATDVRSLLQQRQRFSGTDTPLWDNGLMMGRQALASNRMPSGALLHGDFSEVTVLLWGGGVEVATDPYTQWQTDIVTFRVLLSCDVVAARPGALVRVPAVS